MNLHFAMGDVLSAMHFDGYMVFSVMICCI